MRKEAKVYTPQQVAGAERVIKILFTMPKDTRDIAAMVTNAFVDGLVAGQQLRSDEAAKPGREVLAD